MSCPQTQRVVHLIIVRTSIFRTHSVFSFLLSLGFYVGRVWVCVETRLSIRAYVHVQFVFCVCVYECLFGGTVCLAGPVTFKCLPYFLAVCQ